MTEKEKVSRDDYDQLKARVEALEALLAEKEQQEESDSDKFTDNISDMGGKVFKETSKVLSSLVEASVEALNETAGAMSSVKMDPEKLKDGDIADSLVNVFDSFIEVQKKTLDKFQERYNNEKKE